MLNILIANLPYLLKGAIVTLWISLIVVTFGTLLGTLIGLLATLGGRFTRALVTSYIFVLRGIPVLVVMLLGYYAFPALGFRMNAYAAVAAAQIVYVGAFVAEIVRSAVTSVPSGQVAAAKSLGMRRIGILRYVLLPLATRIAIPPLLNNSLTAIKQTSYVSVVGAWELTYAAREVVERTLAAFQIFLGVMAIYFLICYPLSLLARWCEKRLLVAH
jgi:His/Glu/Gln/Arg/opine family amino acid ABC transporter permease subunit